MKTTPINSSAEARTRSAASWAVSHSDRSAERTLVALAGSVALLSAPLAATVSAGFLLLTVNAGLNQWLFALTGACAASLLINRLAQRRTQGSAPSGGPVR